MRRANISSKYTMQLLIIVLDSFPNRALFWQLSPLSFIVLSSCSSYLSFPISKSSRQSSFILFQSSVRTVWGWPGGQWSLQGGWQRFTSSTQFLQRVYWMLLLSLIFLFSLRCLSSSSLKMLLNSFVLRSVFLTLAYFYCRSLIWLYCPKQWSILMFLLRSTVGRSVWMLTFCVSRSRQWVRSLVQNRGWSALKASSEVRLARMVRGGRLWFIRYQFKMQKNKKMVTESSREQKRTLRIAESPKKVTKLKLGVLLEASKQREMEQINEVIREKLQDYPNTASRNKGFNPYEAIYHNDLAFWREYCESTGRYQQGGINLKWPYFFTAQPEEQERE